MILNIETSTRFCSLCISNGCSILFSRQTFEGPNHAAVLGVFLEQAVAFVREKGFKLQAVAVSGGPGSYTGLRIGVSLAKGYAFGQSLPLIALDTLQVMASALTATVSIEADALISPMLDARRMEVYQAFYASNNQRLNDVRPVVLDEYSFQEELSRTQVYFVGDGSPKFRPICLHENARFVEINTPLAPQMAELSQKAFETKSFVDVAYYEPFYLKEFIATVAKNKVL